MIYVGVRLQFGCCQKCRLRCLFLFCFYPLRALPKRTQELACFSGSVHFSTVSEFPSGTIGPKGPTSTRLVPVGSVFPPDLFVEELQHAAAFRSFSYALGWPQAPLARKVGAANAWHGLGHALSKMIVAPSLPVTPMNVARRFWLLNLLKTCWLFSKFHCACVICGVAPHFHRCGDGA